MLEDYNFLHSSFKEKDNEQNTITIACFENSDKILLTEKIDEWFSFRPSCFGSPDRFFEFLNGTSNKTILILNEDKVHEEFLRAIRVSGKKIEVISFSPKKSNLYDLKQVLENLLGNQLGNMGLTTKSLKMQELIKEIRLLGSNDLPVLITGPSGSGKKSVACALHRISSRSKFELIHINFNGLGPSLAEIDIFQIKTDDLKTGTIYLQNIEKLPEALRSKVLEIIRSKKKGPRFIFGTSLSLSEFKEVDQELFHLIGSNILTVPPLSSRKEDIPIIIDQFIRKYSSLHNSKGVNLDREAMEVLTDFHWPSNVLELENLIERLIILHGGATIGRPDLPEKFKKNKDNSFSYHLPIEGLVLKKFLFNIEMSLISQALSRSNGNKNKAAKLLGLNRTTLVEKLKKKVKDT